MKTKTPIARGTKTMPCSCGRIVQVSADTRAVECAYCTQIGLAAPQSYTKPETTNRTTETGKTPGWPTCWWLKKEFVGPDGKTYHKGKEVI